MSNDQAEQPEKPNIEQEVSSPAPGTLVCMECGAEYAFTEQEKADFAARGFQPPKRCVECRVKRRRKRNFPTKRRKRAENPDPQQGSVGEYPPNPGYGEDTQPDSYVTQAESIKSRKENKPSEMPRDVDEDNFGNSIHYKGPGVDVRFGTARDGGPKFAPWEGAHGYLLTHHEAEKKKPGLDRGRKARPGGHGKNQSPRGADGSRHSASSKRQRQSFDIVCATCGIATQVPFKPIPGKPVFCRDCHKKSRQETPPAESTPTE